MASVNASKKFSRIWTASKDNKKYTSLRRVYFCLYLKDEY